MNNRYIVPFIDLCLNALFVFIVLFMLTPKKKQDQQSISTSGEYAIVISWGNESLDDVDTYILDPVGHLVFFNRREDGLMHLERDDLGALNDQEKTPDGKQVQIQVNEERVIIRGIIKGEYVVNVHMYSKRDPDPTKVKITLIKMRGKNANAVMVEKEVVLEKNGDEKTAFRFKLSADGDVININTLPRKIVGSSTTRRR